MNTTHTVITIGHDGTTKQAHDFTSKKAAISAWHEFAIAGVSAYVLSPKGHTLHGYSVESGPVVVVDGELRPA